MVRCCRGTLHDLSGSAQELCQIHHQLPNRTNWRLLNITKLHRISPDYICTMYIHRQVACDYWKAKKNIRKHIAFLKTA